MKMRRGDVMTESHRGTSEALFPSSMKNDFSNARKIQPGPRSGSYIFLPGTAKIELIETMGR